MKTLKWKKEQLSRSKSWTTVYPVERLYNTMLGHGGLVEHEMEKNWDSACLNEKGIQTHVQIVYQYFSGFFLTRKTYTWTF